MMDIAKADIAKLLEKYDSALYGLGTCAAKLRTIREGFEGKNAWLAEYNNAHRQFRATTKLHKTVEASIAAIKARQPKPDGQ